MINKYPSIVINLKSLKEVCTGDSVDYFNLKIFGCLAFTHQNEGKFKHRAIKYIFLNYFESVKGYRLLIKDGFSYKVIISSLIVMLSLMKL